MNFGQNKRLDRIIEVLALSALMASKPSKKVEKRLKEIAFPLEIELWSVNVANNGFLGIVELTDSANTVTKQKEVHKWEDQENQYNHSHSV